MKHLLSFISLFLLCSTQARPCHLSDLSLVSVTPSGSDFIITVSLNIGRGILGGDQGGDDDTGTIAFGFYTSGSDPLLSFSPSTITGVATGCVSSGINTGPQGSPYDTQGTIIYIIGSCPNNFTCVTSNSNCGDPMAENFDFTFTVNEMPNSISVFGVEGNGNPVAGCTGNPDMTIDFTAMPLEWGVLNLRITEKSNILDWKTLSEIDNNYFIIERSPNGQTFEEQGRIEGAGTNLHEQSYSWEDKYFITGIAYYRIKQVDLDGSFSYSEIKSANRKKYIDVVKLYPNPAKNSVNISIQSEYVGAATLTLLNHLGQKVKTQSLILEGNKFSSSIDLTGLSAGVYYAEVIAGNEKWQERLVVE